MRAPDFTTSTIRPVIELAAPGKHEGHFELLHSDDRHPLGAQLIPAMSLVGGAGPSVLLVAGVHGDEYEGPVALMRLFQSLAPEAVSGRIVFLPMANAPAARAGTRCSPLDGGNLNRVFPGDPKGTPTERIAHLIADCLIPAMDAVIDLHSGGRASVFAPTALAARGVSEQGLQGGLDAANMALARVFGTEQIWVLPSGPGVHSLNAGATRHNVACVAAELGGAGRVGREALAIGEAGLRRCLVHLGVIAGDLPRDAAPRAVELGPNSRVITSVSGVYQPAVAVGEEVEAGALLGWIVDMERPSEPPTAIRSPISGFLLAETARGPVAPGDFIAFVATDVTDASLNRGTP